MKHLIGVLVIVLIGMGCSPHKMYEASIPIPAKWSADNGIRFDFEVDDTTNAYNVIVELSHEESFGYQNLYTKIITDFPTGEQAESIVSLDVRKKTGASQGKCSGQTCVVPFLIQKDIYFQHLGKYGITLHQHSRQDTVKGIKNAHLIVQQTETQN